MKRFWQGVVRWFAFNTYRRVISRYLLGHEVAQRRQAVRVAKRDWETEKQRILTWHTRRMREELCALEEHYKELLKELRA